MQTTMLDLGPAAATVTRLVADVRDDQLLWPTPCGDTPVAQLLHHLLGVGHGFQLTARKQSLGVPVASAELPADWRSRLPAELRAMAEAWREPSAWEGTAEAGGVRLPAATMGRVALDELVVHGWDLAVATGRPYPVDDAAVAACLRYVTDFDAELPGARDRIYGPVVPVPDGAPLLDRLLGLTGRDPAWRP